MLLESIALLLDLGVDLLEGSSLFHVVGLTCNHLVGLGYGVVVDRGEAATPLSEGAGYWGGAYCTLSWIDPDQELVAVLMTQVRPYSHLNIRQDFQVLTYQAIVE